MSSAVHFSRILSFWKPLVRHLSAAYDHMQEVCCRRHFVSLIRSTLTSLSQAGLSSNSHRALFKVRILGMLVRWHALTWSVSSILVNLPVCVCFSSFDPGLRTDAHTRLLFGPNQLPGLIH